jgi:uncharacterized protein (DUF697 family)
MASVGRAQAQRVGAFGTLRSFVSVLREISLDDLRSDAETPPRLLVLAPDHGAARRLGLALTGPEGELAVVGREINGSLEDVGRFDAVVVHDPRRLGGAARAKERFRVEGGPAPVFDFHGSGPEDEESIARLRNLLVTRLPERAPAFGRAFPAFRAAAAKAVIDETAKANAQFALVSNVPAVVPIVGSLAAAGADFLVLTKNQVLMIFKLAAIHGRDLHNQWGILQEMVPVVGAGLFWRTLAREAASFVPLAAGTIPKVVIAYAGTLSAGRAADLYYRTDKKPTREQMHAYYRQALDVARKLPLPGIGREDDDDAKRSAEATAPAREPIPLPGVASAGTSAPDVATDQRVPEAPASPTA